MIKVAILIDGSFFIKRYRYINIQLAKTKNELFNIYDPIQTAKDIFRIALAHVKWDSKREEGKKLNEQTELYRILYYDSNPIDKKYHHPLTKRLIDFSKTDEYIFRTSLYNELRKKRKVALRLGKLKEHKSWIISPKATKSILSQKITINQLTEKDVTLDLIQKGVDIRIGLDIASLAYKKLANRIILISGDSDFVPAAKVARREGIDFILDPMGANIDDQLFEHIDGLQSVIK